MHGDGRQQIYIALQFAAYVGFGSYLMNFGEGLPTAALVLGWSAMALGLFTLGVALENRPWALKAELVRTSCGCWAHCWCWAWACGFAGASRTPA